MTLIIFRRWNVAAIPCQNEVGISVSQLVGDDAWGEPGFQREYRICMPPVVQGGHGQPETFANPLMRTEGC